MGEQLLEYVYNYRLNKKMGLEGDPELDETEASMIGWIWAEISSSYVNIGLTFAIVYLLYKILFQK